MSSFRSSGKTAPRLVYDLVSYDPANPPGTARNILSEVPPVYPDNYNGPEDFISPKACSHTYVRKPNQTILPLQEEKGISGTSTKASAICTKCRYHVQIVANSTPGIGQPSQTISDHLHHLIYNSGRYKGGSIPEEITAKGQTVEVYHYECSYLACPLKVSVRVASPVLSEKWVHLLTDRDLLQQRTSEAFAAHRDRLEGLAPPLPINVLITLRQYISNSLQNSQQSKSISAVNKRFITCFGLEGRPCKDLLEFLGFTIKGDGCWDPPRPSAWAEFPFQDQLKVFLDDVYHELSALIEQQPLMEKKANQAAYPSHPAFDDLMYAIDASNYPRAARVAEFQMPSAPYYEDLGAMEDMSAPAIIEAFNRQVAVDPGRAPRYLKCLKEIGNLRGGEDAAAIDQAVQVAYAEGKYTDSDVISAYKYFGLDHDDTRLTDDSIIGKFYAYLGSTIQAQETETRRQLWRIGDSRRSERIKSAAEDRVATVEQAQVFLGVSDETPDDFIMAMFTAKVNDNPSSRELARRAIELIAKARRSDALKHFLKTGEVTGGEMDVSDAYRLLQIPDRTADEGAIMAAYTICVDEAPGQAETYNKALSILAKETNSALLSSLVSSPGAKPDRNLAEWPVGLHNIGNTCYLNSLLQFYFSVSPFRNMVLDFENFKMDLSDESWSRKQVGSRKVSKTEIQRSQKFLRELRTLFSNMISSPESFVTPGQELARLTLISPSNEAAIRRRSTISANRSGGLGEIHGMPILGPLGPPQPTVEIGTKDPITAEPEKIKRPTTSDEDSEATLVSDSVKNDTPTIVQADDKENTPPHGDSVMLDAQDEPKKSLDGSAISNEPASQDSKTQSNQPPPIPPRPTTSVDRQKQLIEEVEIGAQQDVTEVINNVLFQSQCAIQPLSFAQDGEQVDQVKDLFYGKSKSYIVSEKGVRSKEEWWSDIKIDVATGSRDIYTAIDGAFDIQKVNVENSVAEQFAAISKLPPILQIQVQRVQFDSVKKRSFKSTHHLELKETIYLDRYMDSHQQVFVNRRKQCWEWKETLRGLEARREELLRETEADNLDTPALLNSAKEVLEELNNMKDDPDTAHDAIDVDLELLPELEKLSETAQAELQSLEQEIKHTQTLISNQFVDYKNLPYRLYAVFVHHGSVEFGHYYIYIYDYDRQVWRKYNDNYVTEVHDLDEIFKSQERPNPPTPYFLVYVHDALKDRLVNPLCRQIVESSPVNGSEEDASTSMAIDGVTTTTTTTTTGGAEDIDMDPPAYNEICADKSTSGEEADFQTEEQEKSSFETENAEASRPWSSNTGADSHGMNW